MLANLTLQYGIANHQALMAKYDYLNYNKFNSLLSTYQRNVMTRLRPLYERISPGKDITPVLCGHCRYCITVYIHHSDHEESVLAVAIGHYSQDFLGSLRPPFDSRQLFAYSLNTSIHTLKDLRAMLRSLGIYIPANKRFNRSQITQRVYPELYSIYHKPSEPPAKRPRYSKKPSSATATSSQLPTSSQ